MPLVGFYRRYPVTPSKRFGVNKRKSARRFRKQAARTKAANMGGLARGGWRL